MYEPIKIQWQCSLIAGEGRSGVTLDIRYMRYSRLLAQWRKKERRASTFIFLWENEGGCCKDLTVLVYFYFPLSLHHYCCIIRASLTKKRMLRGDVRGRLMLVVL